MRMLFFDLIPTLICVAAIGYLAIGAAILDKAMGFIHRHAVLDADFRRMSLQDGQRRAVMRIAQLAVLAGWPLAVAAAMIANGRRQTRGFAAP